MNALKNVGMFLLAVLVQVYIWIATATPLMGIFFFGLMMISEFIVMYGAYSSSAIAALSIGWKIYLGMAVYVMFVMTTMAHLNCCFGEKTFIGHLKHAKYGHFRNLGTALCWPLMLYLNDQEEDDKCCQDWPNTAYCAIEYWWMRISDLPLQTKKH